MWYVVWVYRPNLAGTDIDRRTAVVLAIFRDGRDMDAYIERQEHYYEGSDYKVDWYRVASLAGVEARVSFD